MNRYNENELTIEVAKAIEKGIVSEGIYTCLIFIPDNYQNDAGYVDVKRFGYNRKTGILDYLGCTDIMPYSISNNKYSMDFIPGGIQLFRKDREPFKVDASYYCDTKIEE